MDKFGEQLSMVSVSPHSDSLELDFDKLQKGDRIPQEEVERLVGSERGTDDFNLGALNLCSEIERSMKRRGEPATVRILQGDVVILSDSEAVDYNYDGAWKGARKIQRRFSHLCDVNKGNLDEGTRRRHEDNLITVSRLVGGIEVIAETVQPDKYRRRTPGLETYLNAEPEEDPVQRGLREAVLKGLHSRRCGRRRRR